MEQNKKAAVGAEKLTSLLDSTMTKLHDMTDTETVIGEPLVLSERLTMIPLSRTSFGFASGGSDYGKDSGNIHFVGGSGAGVTVTPLGFIVIADEINVSFLPVSGGPGEPTTLDVILNHVPGAVDMVKELLAEKKAAKAAKAAQAEADNN